MLYVIFLYKLYFIEVLKSVLRPCSQIYTISQDGVLLITKKFITNKQCLDEDVRKGILMHFMKLKIFVTLKTKLEGYG